MQPLLVGVVELHGGSSDALTSETIGSLYSILRNRRTIELMLDRITNPLPLVGSVEA